MIGPIYKLSMTNYTGAWYQLSERERDHLLVKRMESLEKVGGKVIVSCSSAWSSEQWLWFGVEEYPDIEAVHKHTEDLLALNWFRYFVGVTTLGTKWESF